MHRNLYLLQCLSRIIIIFGLELLLVETFELGKVERAVDGVHPKPLVIGASQIFEGNDGPWSTFNLRVGTPQQDVRVLLSTASPQSMVVLSEYGCSSIIAKNTTFPCALSRGNLFNLNASTTWNGTDWYGINADGVGFEANLGYKQTALYGLDTLGIGLADGSMGVSLERQTVAGVADISPFYLGVFGLGTQPVNFSTLGNFSAPSFITTLRDRGIIPSLSWSYTAGSQFHLKKVFGQLVFGGYDSARFQPNHVSFDLAPDQDRNIVVAIQQITYAGTNQANLLETPFYALIDSTDPFIWLPREACMKFEKAFNLTLDVRKDRYLLTQDQHSNLLQLQPSVTFWLSNSLTGGETVSINLPYSAFDLVVDYPIVSSQTFYFPLKRAANETQYTLGRAFLQEA